jgi:nucleotide-binding universal stress UspA family protein
MIETILVATDGSEAAGAAERYAVGLSSRIKARVSGFTVVEDRDVRTPKDDGMALPSFPEAEVRAYYRARAEATSRRFAERARSENVEASCETAQGVADDRIVEKAQSADLLVIGRDGKGASSRSALVGSTVDGVIRKAVKACLVVPTGAPLTGPIVLGFDGSPGSRLAASLAVELAGSIGEAVHVFVDSKDKGRAVARFEEVRQLVGGLSVPVRETSSTLGRPDVKLVDTAREARGGLIVMGAFGRNRITDYFLGSNAAAVVRTSPVAVLLAR